jgi:hypothetical protein
MADAEEPVDGVKVGPWGTILTLLWLVGWSVLCLYALTAIWPHPTPSGVAPVTDTAKSDTVAKNTAETNTAATDTGTTTGTVTVAMTTETTTPATTTTAQPPAPAVNCDEAGYANCEDCCWKRVQTLRQTFFNGDKEKVKNDPACVYIFGGWHVMWGETRLLLIVMLCGFLGSLIYSLRSFFWYTGNRNLVMSWLAQYAFVPIVGAMLAVVFYLVLRGGLFSSTTTISDTSPFGFAAVAALVGMFINQAAEKLRSVFETLMTKAQTGKDPAVRALPVLASVTPSPVAKGAADTVLTVTGDHFYPDSKVFANTTELATTFKNEKQLQATLPAAMIVAAGEIAITVSTPNAGKSTAFKLTVT